MARLGDVCTFFVGTGFPNQYQGNTNGEYPFFKVGDISRNVQMGQRTLQCCDNYIDDKIVKIIRGTIIPQGTVVFAKIGEALRHNRRAITPCKCLVDNNVMGLKPIEEKLNIGYFYYFMAALDLQKYCEATTVPSVRKSTLERVEIFIPSMEEQKKIASILDKLSNLISLRKQQLAKLDELVKARFVEMFGDPEVNPFGWHVTQLCQLVTVEPQNGLYKPQSDYVQDGRGVPILRIDAFYNGKVTSFKSLKRLICSDVEIQRYLLREDDIVINRVNSIEYLGKCAHIKGMSESTVFESNMMRLHLNEEVIDAEYATYLLCSQYIYNQILQRAKKAVNQASINQEDVQSFRILVPPLKLQRQFAAFVVQTDKSKLTIQQNLDKLEVLKKALMQEYFG